MPGGGTEAMVDNDGVVRSISWRDLCPWTLLFRVFRLSVSLQPLALALLGALFCSLGWWLIGAVLLSETSRQDPSVRAFQANVVQWPDRHSLTAVTESDAMQELAPTEVTPSTVPAPPAPTSKAPAESTKDAAREANQNSTTQATPVANTVTANVAAVQTSDRSLTANPAAEIAKPSDLGPELAGPRDSSTISEIWHGTFGRAPFYAIAEPLRRWLVPGIPWDQRGYYLLGGLWTIAVWSWFGGAITRIAAVRLGRDERVGFRESLEFARRKLISFLGAPLLPMAGILALMLPLILLGLIMRLNIGVALAGLVWGLMGLIGFGIALFAIGLLFGWPLMWATISTEGSDAFDGISRSYAYTFQRPLHYLAYFLIAAVLGLLGWVLVDLFFETLIQLVYLAVGMGAGAVRVEQIRAALTTTDANASSLVWFGAILMSATNRVFRGFLRAYGFSYLWVAASAIYLLLRHDADQAELDDVFLEEDDQATYGLPRLQPDEAGVPGVAADDTDEETAE